MSNLDTLLALATDPPWELGNTPAYLMMLQQKDEGARVEDPVTLRSPAHTEEIATFWNYLLPTAANARLAALAVNNVEELVGALRLCHRAMQRRDDGNGEPANNPDWYKGRDAARDVLARLEEQAGQP